MKSKAGLLKDLSTSYPASAVHLDCEYILTGPSSSQTAHSSQKHPVHYCMFPSVRRGPIKHLVSTQLEGYLELHFVKSIYRERAVIQYACRFAKCIHPGH